MFTPIQAAEPILAHRPGPGCGRPNVVAGDNGSPLRSPSSIHNVCLLPAPSLDLLLNESCKDDIEMRRWMHCIGKHEGLIGSLADISPR